MKALFKAYYSKKGQQTWVILLILTPIILWVLPGDFFDGDGLILCPSRLFFGIECFGCGMTRAIMHLHHWQLDDAIFYNLGSLVVYPGLIIIWFIWLRKAALRLDLLPLKKSQAATD